MKMRNLVLTLASLAVILSACTGRGLTPGGWAGLIADQNTAYVANNLRVYAVNLADGTQKWRFPENTSPSEAFYSNPALTTDGQLLVGGYDKKLYSLNAGSGQPNPWVFPGNDRFIGGPLAIDQRIYAPNADRNLYALDLKGQKLWSYTTGEPLWAAPAYDAKCDCLYQASMDHNVYAINAKDGSLIWKTNLGSAIAATPALSQDGRVFVGNFNNEMVALDAQNGTILWRTPLKGWAWAGPALDGGNLYFGDLKGFSYALSSSNGSVLWETTLDGPVAGTPLITQQAIYFGTETGSVFAVDRSGKPVWNSPVGGKIYTSPVAAGDLILVAPMETNPVLVALNTNGSAKWSFVPPK